MSGAQPMAVTMNGGVVIDVEVRPERIERKVKEGYCDKMTNNTDEALTWMQEALKAGKSLSIGLAGNAADVYPDLVKQDMIPDIVTDQTSSHNLLDYVPQGKLDTVLQLLEKDPETYRKKSLESIVIHTQAILDMQAKGAVAFDYGNNLRGQAEKGGLKVRDKEGRFLYHIPF